VRLLLDAQLSPRIAELLTERGSDAQAVISRRDLADNTPDARLMEIARREGRAMVTNNVKDGRPIAAERLASGQGHCGLILVGARTPRTKAAAEPLADAIEQVMRANPAGLADSERWI
jgi:hypothetical protein